MVEPSFTSCKCQYLQVAFIHFPNMFFFSDGYLSKISLTRCILSATTPPFFLSLTPISRSLEKKKHFLCHFYGNEWGAEENMGENLSLIEVHRVLCVLYWNTKSSFYPCKYSPVRLLLDRTSFQSKLTHYRQISHLSSSVFIKNDNSIHNSFSSFLASLNTTLFKLNR